MNVLKVMNAACDPPGGGVRVIDDGLRVGPSVTEGERTDDIVTVPENPFRLETVIIGELDWPA